ncbi:DUF3139 domain-containing protein [Clostridium drakei]|uniref:DUF3139 domain-containing protein n=1 Tax=Clostridium drakei TaxID=332101 RepID=A0A2U8DQ99_9CLOT|nr:DUF3139 domain-containing protein [Clostridium drakei]AWI04651.1 DUF3139 domain-containing protein [Clostridium drakei]
MRTLKRRTLSLVVIFIISIFVVGCGETASKEYKEEPVEIITQKVVKVEPIESVKQKVTSHLTAKGYKEGDFKLTVEYNKDNINLYKGPYSINVIFNDEPNVIYNYRYNYDSELKDITQTSISPMKDKNFKHAE